MQLGRAFSFIFEDEKWLTKTLINAIVNMIPIVNIAAIGWSVQLINNVIRDDMEHPMPDWDDFGKKFEVGLSILVASIVYNLVVMVVICCIAIIPGLMANVESLEVIAAILMILLSLVAIVASIIVNAALLIGIVEFTFEENLSVFWKFGYNFSEAWNNIGILITMFIFILIAGIGIGLFGWFPCVGWILAAMIAPPVMGHLTGQAGQKIAEKRHSAHPMT